MRIDYSQHSSAPQRRPFLSRVRPIVVVAALLATALAGLPATPRAQAATSFTFEGGGFGHSVGMSQFGAYGMSRQGASWQDIMTHYYTGATPGDAHPSQVDDPLWVNLTMEQTSITLSVFATGGATTRRVVARLGGQTIKASVGENIVLQKTGSGCRVTTPEGSLQGSCSIDLDWDGFNGSPKVGVELQGCSLVNWNAPGGSQVQPCRYARGAARVRPDNNTATMNLSLEIDIEDYILGISEMPYAWGSTGGMAALQAQAVAARSYALHRAVLRGDAEDRPWCWCHLYDTTLDQHYVGWGHGTQNWVDAVSSTAGKVMHHPSESYAGNPLPIETFYSSSTFGWTENSEDGFISWVPYLRSVDDHWSQLPEVNNHSARWTRTFSGSQLASLLPGMSTVTGVEITECSQTGAALELTFHGSGGPRAFETRTLRGTLSLKSMQIISINGSSPCSGPGVPSAGGPAALAGVTIDDDSVGDSLGDGDGVAECGETIEMWTAIATEGATITGVKMELAVADPHVSVVWNTTSSAADVAPGAAVANDGDWDLAISPDAPDGHLTSLHLTVSADNGGPWSLQVPLQISCGSSGGGGGGTDGPSTTVEAVLGTSIPDVNGNGSPDLATVVVNDRGRAKLVVVDGQTGKRLSLTHIGGKGTDVVAADIVSLEGTDGPDHRVAVALNHETRASVRLVIVDAAAGERIAVQRARGDAIDIEPLPGTGTLALTLGRPDRTLIRALDAVTGDRLPFLTRRAGDVVDTEPVAGHLALLLGDDGKTKVRLLDAAGTVVDTIGFGRAGVPGDLEMASSDGQPLLVVTKTTADRAIIDTRGLTDGTRVSVRRLTISDLLDTTTTGEHGLVALVRTTNGMRVFVTDTTTGTLTRRIAVNQPTSPIAVAALDSDRIAVIGNSANGPRATINDVGGTRTTVRLR
jgi:SpoIID/LytB domain protein